MDPASLIQPILGANACNRRFSTRELAVTHQIETYTKRIGNEDRRLIRRIYADYTSTMEVEMPDNSEPVYRLRSIEVTGPGLRLAGGLTIGTGYAEFANRFRLPAPASKGEAPPRIQSMSNYRSVNGVATGTNLTIFTNEDETVAKILLLCTAH